MIARIYTLAIAGFIAWEVLTVRASAVDPQPPNREGDLYCDLRSATGASIAFELLRASSEKASFAFVGKRNGSPYPPTDQTYVFVFSRQSGSENEYVNGPQIMRIGRQGEIRDISIWSTRDAKPLQPVAYGFCTTEQLSTVVEAAPSNGNPFDPKNWKPGCHMTKAGRQPVHSSFTKNDIADSSSKLFTEFDGLVPSGKISVPREILAKPPAAEHPDVFVGVGRFQPEAQAMGATGTDTMYLDEKTSNGALVVRFTEVNGDRSLRYAICGVKNERTKR